MKDNIFEQIAAITKPTMSNTKHTPVNVISRTGIVWVESTNIKVCLPENKKYADRIVRAWNNFEPLLFHLEKMATRLAETLDREQGKPVEDPEIAEAFAAINKATQ
jgi:hypothetical protein